MYIFYPIHVDETLFFTLFIKSKIGNLELLYLSYTYHLYTFFLQILIRLKNNLFTSSNHSYL